jgi:hypothetical protein
MFQIPFDETILYKKALSKEELEEASKEIRELTKKRNVILQIILSFLPIIAAVLAASPIGGQAKKVIAAGVIPALGGLASIFSLLATPIMPKEYAFGSNAVYLDKRKLSWIKLELRNIAIKVAKQGLLLKPEKRWHRVIFIFTKEVKVVEGIIKTHLKIRY